MIRSMFGVVLCALLCLAMMAGQALGACDTARNRGLQHQVLDMPGLERKRLVRVYLPPDYACAGARRYPVIYMHDAQNLFADATAAETPPHGGWGVEESLDALARTHDFAAIVVGIDHGGTTRTTELSPWTHPRFGAAEGEAYLHFIVHVVKPWADQHFRTLAGPEDTAIAGSSLGGLMSHYAIHAHPEIFGKAAVLSPAYWFAPPVAEYTRQHRLPDHLRFYLYVGGREGDEAVTDARGMRAVLAAQHGPDWQGLRMSEVDDGEHNELAWRKEFRLAVIWMFGLTEDRRSRF